MKDYKTTAKKVIEYVGEKKNVINTYHCMTRLRFNLINNDKVDVSSIKNDTELLGLNWDNSGELQIIIGTDVDNLYKEVIELTGLEPNEKINVNLDEKKKLTFKSMFNGVVNAFSASMNPLVPMFVLVGTFNIVAALIGPSFFNLVSTESNLYKNFYDVGQAIIYYLPVLIAIPAAKHFKTNKYISLILACLLVYPTISESLATEAYTVFGIPAINATYSSSVIPIMLIIWIQSYVEKLVDKISIKSLKVIMFPFLTVVIMLPLALCVLGPVGTIVGNSLANFIITLRTTAGPIATTLVAALIPFLTAFGIGRPIFFICMAMLFADGVEYAYMPISMVLTNFIAAGVALGYTFKTKVNKSIGITSFIAVALGGVSEPTWFGILLPNKKTYLPAIIGGAISGLYLGIMNVGYYQFGPSNVLSVIGYVSETNPSNFIHGCIAAGLAFFVTLGAMLVLFKDEEKNNSVTKKVSINDEIINSPIAGTALPLSESTDSVFSSETIGKGLLINPTEGMVVAPFDGEIVSLFPTNHAIGIKSNGGCELLIHIGIDTVKLKGKYFECFVKQNDTVKVGEPLIRFDINAIKNEGYSTEIPIVITNSNNYREIVTKTGIEVKPCEEIIKCKI